MSRVKGIRRNTVSLYAGEVRIYWNDDGIQETTSEKTDKVRAILGHDFELQVVGMLRISNNSKGNMYILENDVKHTLWDTIVLEKSYDSWRSPRN